MTPNAIYIRSPLTNRKLLECESADGIVSAQVSSGTSSLFAVADGQIVVLHDAKLGADKKYKLKNGDVQGLQLHALGTSLT